MNIIIFSKDRASQLDLFIRSIKKYFKEFDDLTFNVLYTYSTDSFRVSYDKLITIHDDTNIKYIKETKPFKEHLLSLIDETIDHTLFFVDDMVFKNDFSLKSLEYKLFSTDDEILSLSLRLHKNLSYCYPARLRMIPPKFDSNSTFRWRGQSGDYGYPMSLDGHFFRTKDIILLFKGLKYNNPNSLESQLASYPINRPKMICFNESSVVTVPVNKVQTFNNNIFGEISAEFLNEKFLNDYLIDLEPFDGVKNISCHQEFKYEYIKNKDK